MLRLSFDQIYARWSTRIRFQNSVIMSSFLACFACHLPQRLLPRFASISSRLAVLAADLFFYFVLFIPIFLIFVHVTNVGSSSKTHRILDGVGRVRRLGHPDLRAIRIPSLCAYHSPPQPDANSHRGLV